MKVKRRSHTPSLGALLIAGMICFLSWLGLHVAEVHPGKLSDGLAVMSYCLFLPGGLIAKFFTPPSDDGANLYPLGLALCFVFYFVSSYLILKQLRRGL